MKRKRKGEKSVLALDCPNGLEMPSIALYVYTCKYMRHNEVNGILKWTRSYEPIMLFMI